MGRYDYVQVTEAQGKKMNEIREKFKEIQQLLDDLVAPSRELSLVTTKLEEACMWAMKAISHGNLKE